MTRVTLYAQPYSEEPALPVDENIYSHFKKSDEGKIFYLTDVGKRIWLTAKKISQNARLILKSYKSGGYEWVIEIHTPSLIIKMKMIDYRKKRSLLAKKISHMVISLEFNGHYYLIINFLKNFMKSYRKKPYNISEWDDFKSVFGISKNDVIYHWNYLMNFKLKSKMREDLKEIKEMYEEVIDLGADLSDAKIFIENAEKSLKNEKYEYFVNYIETAKRVILNAKDYVEKLRELLRNASNTITLVEAIILKSEEQGIDVSKPKEYLKKAREALKDYNDWETAMKNANLARNIIEHMLQQRNHAMDAMRVSEGLLREAETMDIDITWAKQLYEKAEDAMNRGEYLMAMNYASTIRNTITKMRREREYNLTAKEIANTSISYTSSLINEAASYLPSTDEYTEKLKDAEANLENGNYERAIEIAEEVRSDVEDEMNKYSRAYKELQNALVCINDAKNFINTEEIEKYAEKSRKSLQERNYTDCINYAHTCIDMVEVSQFEEEPRISVSFQNKTLREGMWNRIKMTVKNSGIAHANNVFITVHGPMETTKIPGTLLLPGKNEREIEIGIKPNDAGEIPYTIETTCGRTFDGVIFRFTSRGWLKVIPEAEGMYEEDDDELERTKIDEIFLIYHDGRQIYHESRRAVQNVDDMILSGMLMAVQTFIKDSFRYDDVDLGKLEFGTHKLIIEKGDYIFLVTILTGKIPSDMRVHMKEIVKIIEEKHKNKLENWDGNMNDMQDIHGIIRTLFDHEEDIE